MKHILYTLCAAAALAACTQDYADWAQPQTNDPEASQQFSFTAESVPAIDLADAEGDSVQVFAPTFVGDGLAPTYTVQLTDDVALTTDGEGRVAVEDLQGTVTDLYGKAPTQRDFADCLVKCYATVDGTTYAAATTATVSISVTPYASAVIDQAYHLVGDMCGWSDEGKLTFSHSDSDVYDDPEFTLVFTTTADNQYWKIIPQSNIDADNFWGDGVLGVATDGDTSLSGKLTSNNPGAGKIEAAGTYRMVINMMDCTYEITPVSDLALYYVTGNPNSWSSEGNIIAFPQGNNEYAVTAYYSAAWDFKIWESSNLGDWDNMIGCTSANESDKPASGTLVTSDVACITAPAAGWYTCTLDMTAMTYTFTPLDTPTEYGQIGVVGNGDDWDNDVFLTQVGTSHNWIGTITIANCSWGVKFRADAAWTQDWGADVDISTQWYGTGVLWGSNITIPDGTYTIHFNDITGDFAFIAQ